MSDIPTSSITKSGTFTPRANRRDRKSFVPLAPIEVDAWIDYHPRRHSST
jgi:hypothetical protein